MMAAALRPLLVTLLWAAALRLPTETHGAGVQAQTPLSSWNLEQMARALQFDWPPASPKAALLAQALERLIQVETGWQEWEQETKAEAAVLAQLILHLLGNSHLEPEVNIEEAVALDPKAEDEAANPKQALIRFLVRRLLAKITENRISPFLVRGAPWLLRRRLPRDLGPGLAPMSQEAALFLNRLEASGAKGKPQAQRGAPLAPTHY